MSALLAYIWKNLPLNKTLQLKIMRLFHDSFLVAVSGVVLNENGHILLFKHTYRQNAWGLPGGYIKAREHPQEALEREIEEESGLIISIDERLKIRTDRQEARLEICYLGYFLGGQFVPSAEVSDCGFFSLDTLPLMPKNQLMMIKLGLKKHDV